MQLAAEQTSLEPLPHREGAAGRGPFVSQNAKGERQPIRERSHRAQRLRISDPQTPEVD